MPGYDRNRFKDLRKEEEDEFICGICQDIFKKPVIVPCCRQAYCDDCINQWLTDHQTCPNDRSNLERSGLTQPPVIILNLLAKLKIQCDFASDGCAHVCQLDQLSHHLSKQCQYNPERMCTNEICRQKQKSLENMVNEKERTIESLNANLKLSEEKCVLLETELKQKIENENRMEIMKHDLMDSIRLTEAKNSLLEEQLRLNEDEVKALKIQCSEQQELIDDMRTKLILANSELEKYRLAQSKQTLGHDSETRFLREKLEELKTKCEKLKRIKECSQQEKIEAINCKTKLEVELQMTRENVAELKQRVSKADLELSAELKAKEILMKKYIDDVNTPYKSLNDALIEARQQPKADITIDANDMSQEMKMANNRVTQSMQTLAHEKLSGNFLEELKTKLRERNQ